ncbi:MAG TPA: DNA polymerase I [Cyclobacteriaceae bacterium]|nr:DNA polymerase I [Cyclobacteriaceae bacterium]HMV07693.1 DNA polymerase I [Cyclobacteriaceae bacterium]HMV88494.1 DNA polymerase I [Cyclobacteriaceae bacterium]HMW98828.1 DNA polymerase I [Cyclobacteriaceae bacterium]HMX48539.1 DNA polymerase I [Cyclobacteriaceae bacterium]
MAETKRLFLLDAYALVYRAHFAFTKTPRINSKGINTSVPFGFTNTLLEVLTKQKPTHIGVAFDTAAKTFRDQIYKEYKANRQETPEDIRYGVPKVKEIIRGFNIPVLEMDGYEADDIIGTLAKQAEKLGFEVFMMTPDKDFGQLVTEHIHLYKPAYMGNAVDIMGPKEVCEKWDIENVSQVIDILGLQGDSSDNIPGIPGIGPKTAAELIKKFGNVENIVANAHQLKGKQKERVEEFGQQAILSKQLATISLDVPVHFDEEALLYTGPDEAKLKPIIEELEFKTMMPRIFGGGTAAQQAAAAIVSPKAAQLSMFGGTPEAAETEAPVTEARTFSSDKVNYKLIDTSSLRKELLEKLKLQSSFSVEAIYKDAALIGFAFAWAPGEAALLSFDPEDAKTALTELAGVLSDERNDKTGHNLKGVLLALKEYSIDLCGTLFDTTVAHYLIEPEASHDLKTLCSLYLGYQLMEEGGQSQLYLACERADLVLQLRQKLSKELEKRRHVKLMKDVEMPLMKVLATMEYEGVRIDEKALAAMSQDLRKESEKVQKEIYKTAGQEFNIGSPKQLGEVLFDKLKLGEGKIKKTKTGQYATGEDVLLKLAEDNPIAKKILDYREYEKLRSTYVDALPRLISKRDGRVHTDYRQAVAATGRLSSNNPNLQNIPIRTEKGRQIRKAFVSRDKDYLFMSADYSQIELRIAASFAKDEIMIDAFRNKRDIHTTTAAKVFKVSLDKVTLDMRRKAKEVNFGILYGSTAFGLSQNLGISRTEASEIIDSYFKEFHAIKRYMDNSIIQARDTEFVETILGRRRYLRDINSRNVTTRGFAERNAINAPIQGSAADIIKLAMINIQRWLTKENLKTKMIMQVHDELVFDVHKSEVDKVKDNVRKLMEHAVILDVPMEVEVGVADNWLDAH